MFHITDGDVALEMLQAGSVEGEGTAWLDVLHEGPVPRTSTLEALSAVRSQFVAESGWASGSESTDSFVSRDAQLRAATDHEEVVLWFEAGLYGQLQLLQVLDYFESETNTPDTISLVEIDGYFGKLRPENNWRIDHEAGRVTSVGHY